MASQTLSYQHYRTYLFLPYYVTLFLDFFVKKKNDNKINFYLFLLLILLVLLALLSLLHIIIAIAFPRIQGMGCIDKIRQA